MSHRLHCCGLHAGQNLWRHGGRLRIQYDSTICVAVSLYAGVCDRCTYEHCSDVNGGAAVVALEMRHWAHVIPALFFCGVLLTYTGFTHGTNYGHYTR